MKHRPAPWIAVFLVMLFAHAAVARAASAPGDDATPTAAAAHSSKTPPYDPAKAAAASQIQDPEAATRAYLDSVSAERRAQTKSYSYGNYVLHVVDFVVSAALMVLLIALGISVRFRNLARRITRVRALQSALNPGWQTFFLR